MTVEPRWAWDFVLPTHRAAAGSGLGSILIETRANKDPALTTFVASTDSPDRAMDVVRQNWKLAAYRSNPVILDNHDHRRVVGRAVDVTVPKSGDDAGKLIIDVEWDVDSPDMSIRNVGHQHRSGFRKAGSVGFRAGKKTRRDKLPPDHEYYQAPIEVETWWGTEMMAGWLFESPELLEFSSATVPMNAEALQRSIFTHRRADTDGDGTDDGAEPSGFDLLAFLGDAEQRKAVLDLLWPDVLGRISELVDTEADEEPEPDADGEAADEPVADKAWRRLWVPRLHELLRTDATARRILRAALDSGPPPAPAATPFLSLLARELEKT